MLIYYAAMSRIFLLNGVLIAYAQHPRLNAHADESRGTSGLNVYLSFHLRPYVVYEEKKKVCGETSHTYSLAKAFASC